MSQISVKIRRNKSREVTGSSGNSIIEGETSAGEQEVASSGDVSEDLDSQESVTSSDDPEDQEPWTEEEQTEEDDTEPSSQHPPPAPEVEQHKEPSPPPPRENRPRRKTHNPRERRSSRHTRHRSKLPSEETESVASDYTYEGYDPPGHGPHPGWKWVPNPQAEHGYHTSHHAPPQPSHAYHGYEHAPPQQPYAYPGHGAPPPPQPQQQQQGSQLVPYHSHESYYQNNPFTSPYGPPGHNPLSPAYGAPGHGGYFDPYRAAPPAIGLLPYSYFQQPVAPQQPPQQTHSSSHSPAPPDPTTQQNIAKLHEMLQAQEHAKAREEVEQKAKADADARAADLRKALDELAKMKEAAAALEAQRAKDEIERLKQEAVDAATKQVKEDAEKAAAEKAKKAQEEHEKALQKHKEAEEEAKKAKKEAEDEAKKLKPADDDTQLPIKFKDAVGRKFSFPWKHCKTWKGMEHLIQQAFMHVDGIGEHVAAGHYDLVDPDGEIILPQIWDVVVRPDWSITMHMWPMAEEKEEPPALPDPPPMPAPPPKKHGQDGGGRRGLFRFGEEPKKKRGNHKAGRGPHVGEPPPAVVPDGHVAPGGPIVEIVPEPGSGASKAAKKANRRSVGPSPLMMWAAGTGMRKK